MSDMLRIALRRVSPMFDHRGIHFMSFSHFIAVRAIKEATDAAVSCPPQPRRTPTVSQMARRGCGKEKQWPRHSLRLSTHTDMKSPLDMKWMPRRSYKDCTLRIAIRTTTKPSTTPYLQYMEASAEPARSPRVHRRGGSYYRSRTECVGDRTSPTSRTCLASIFSRGTLGTALTPASIRAPFELPACLPNAPFYNTFDPDRHRSEHPLLHNC